MSTHDRAHVPSGLLNEQFLRDFTDHEGAAVVIEQLHGAFPDFRFEGTEPPYAAFDRRKAIVPWRFTGTMTGPLDPPGFAPTGTRIQFEGDDQLGVLLQRLQARSMRRRAGR